MFLIVTGLSTRPDRHNDNTISLHVITLCNYKAITSNAGALARRWADSACKFGEVISLMKSVDRVSPLVLVHEIIPLGNQVADRAAGVSLTKWRSAIHAASSLHYLFDLVMLGCVVVDFVPVKYSVDGISNIQDMHKYVST